MFLFQKKHKNEALYLYVFSAALLLFLMAVFFNLQNLPGFKNTDVAGPENSVLKAGEVVLVLDFGDRGPMRRFKTFFSDGESRRAWSLLQQAAAYANFDVKVRGQFIPEEIAGVATSEDDGRWQLYINDQKQELSPFGVYVKGGDKTVFKYE